MADCPVNNALSLSKRFCAEVVGAMDRTVDIFYSINEVPADTWDGIVPESKTLLGRHYLQAFEQSVSNNVEFRYIIFRYRGYAEGVAAFQIIQFDATNVDASPEGIVKGFKERMLAHLVRPLSFRMLISGNTFMTGCYGMHFRDGEMNAARVEWLHEGIERIQQAERTQGTPLSGVVVKDFFLEDAKEMSPFKDMGCLEFKAQPNMIVNIQPEWKDFDGYLAAMTSKYRTRIKRALKDLKGLEVKKLDLEYITEHMPRIVDLYAQVIDTSSFKLATFDIKHLIPMKAQFGDAFEVDGFFKDGKLIGFMSFHVTETNEMIAGMLGIDRDEQRPHDLYLNMLVHYIKRGIERNCTRILMGRTAMEIKSSIGAEPYDMVVYMKHFSPIKNAILKPIVSILGARQEQWTQRHPFK